MAFQPVPDTAEFRIIQEFDDPLGTVEIQNSIYVRNTVVPWSTVTLGAMATTIGNAWRDRIRPFLSADDYRFIRVDATDLGVEFGAQSTVLYNVPGLEPGEPTSSVLAALIQLRSGEGGAPRQGRLFVSGFPESAVTRSELTNAVRLSLGPEFLALQNDIEGGGNAWVIVSRFSKSDVPVAPHRRASALTNAVTDITVRDIVGIQRDRRPGE